LAPDRNAAVGLPGAETAFGIQDAFRLLRKHAVLILAIWIMVVGLVGYGLARLPIPYVSNAKIFVKLEESGTPDFFSGIAAHRESRTQEPANRRMENEMELIETWPVAAAVVRELGLTYDQVYHPPLTHLIRPVADLVDAHVMPLLGFRPDPEKRGFADTVAAFQRSFQTRPVPSKSSDTNSNLIALQLRARTAELAQRSLQAVIEAHDRLQLESRQADARRAFEVVTAQAATSQQAVNEAQRRFENFLAEANVNQQVADLGGGAARASDAGQAATQRRELTSPRDSLSVARLKARLQDMQMQQVELQNNFRAPTEQARALAANITALQDQLDREQRRSARNEAQLLALERDLRLKEDTLVELQRRSSQIGLYLAMGEHGVSNRVVVEPPLAPRSSEWRSRAVIGVAGAIAGLLLGVAVAGLRELLDTRLQTTADLRASLGLPVLATLPRLRPSAMHAVAATFGVPGGGRRL
jgi:uncharacterized protein involved in exopolysaccharide biosynthesis